MWRKIERFFPSFPAEFPEKLFFLARLSSASSLMWTRTRAGFSCHCIGPQKRKRKVGKTFILRIYKN